MRISTLFPGYHLIIILLAATMSITLFSGCSDDDPAGGVPTIYNLVELKSLNSSSVSFSLWLPEGTESTTLAGTRPSNLATTTPGECLLLAYRTTSSPSATLQNIEIEASGKVTNSPLMKTEAANLQGWDSDPVYLQSLWRAGDKVCLQAQLTYDTQPRHFALIVDDATINDPTPQAYLYHRRAGNKENFKRTYYAAFDLSALWQHPHVESLNIHVCNSNLTNLTELEIRRP